MYTFTVVLWVNVTLSCFIHLSRSCTLVLVTVQFYEGARPLSEGVGGLILSSEIF